MNRYTRFASFSFFVLALFLTTTGCETTGFDAAEDVAPGATSNRMSSPAGAVIAAEKVNNTKPSQLKSNTKKYRDSSMPSASGRDGIVNVTARALMGSDGVVDLEITTGELDTATKAPGTLSKLQVMALNPVQPSTDNPVWTKNYNGLRNGGAAAYRYEGLKRHQPVYVHANVTGMIRGTAVVKLTEKVKMRPDLHVQRLEAPARVRIDEIVHLTATVAEVNGDVGAISHCVLYAEGQEVDRAQGIWVDAGSAVQCAFMTQFTTAGMKQVKVAVEGVTPGDFSMANNEASATIEVTRSNDFYWHASAHVDVEPYSYRYNYSYDYWYGQYERHEAGKIQYGYVHGWSQEKVSFPMDIDVKMTSGGHEWMNVSYDNAQPNNNWYYNSCFYDFNGGRYVQVCSDYYQQTSFYVQYYAQDVVYYGYDYWGGHYYYEQHDPMLPYGNDLTFDVQISDGTKSLGAEGSVQLNEYADNYDYGYWQYSRRYLSGWGSGYPGGL